MKYAVLTFGCRVNQADSLGLEEQLCTAGATAASVEDADLVFVNTCSVTASADQGARQAIRRIARVNPAAKVVVTGCYATRRPDEIRDLPNVTEVVANDDKPRLLTLVGARLGLAMAPMVTTAERFGDGDGGCGAAIEPGLAGRTAFTLRVQTGCAEACAYCIIPTTRGTPRSEPIETLLREVDRVTAAGFKGIVLTGVHLGSYGRDLTPASCLSALLARLAEHVRGSGVLFRVSSLEPMECGPDVVALFAEEDCFAPHVHLPLQHASPRMLDAMRRPYTVERYAALVGGIRRRVPDAAIGSDAIVGFPGETDDDFEALASYLETSPLTHIHVFPYSDRPGTAATAMDGKVHGTVVRERSRRLREISTRLASAFRDAQVGRVHRGLTLEDGSLVVTGNYLKVRIAPGRARNEWVRVRVTSHHDGELLSA